MINKIRSQKNYNTDCHDFLCNLRIINDYGNAAAFLVKPV